MARQPLQTRYAQSSGAKIAYQVSGTGAPDLVMAHGLVSHLDLQWQQPEYRRFVRALQQGCRLIRLDKRGTGLSDPCVGVPATQQRVQDLAAVMAAAGSSRPVLLGLSDGSAAVAFAAAHPGQIRGLILYGTWYRGPRAGVLRRYRSMVQHWGEGRFDELMAPSLAGTRSRQLAGAFERAAASPAMASALIESLGLIEVEELMGNVAVPTLILHRDQDIVPVSEARLVADQIPGARIKVLHGRDHLPWAGDWCAIAREILDFVHEVAPAGERPEQPGSARPRTRRPAVGLQSLSDAELRVVRLVSQGLGNVQIAAALYLSRYTVETHLKRVFAKLGVESRAELAALFTDREVGPSLDV